MATAIATPEDYAAAPVWASDAVTNAPLQRGARWADDAPEIEAAGISPPPGSVQAARKQVPKHVFVPSPERALAFATATPLQGPSKQTRWLHQRSRAQGRGAGGRTQGMGATAQTIGLQFLEHWDLLCIPAQCTDGHDPSFFKLDASRSEPNVRCRKKQVSGGVTTYCRAKGPLGGAWRNFCFLALGVPDSVNPCVLIELLDLFAIMLPPEKAQRRAKPAFQSLSLSCSLSLSLSLYLSPSRSISLSLPPLRARQASGRVGLDRHTVSREYVSFRERILSWLVRNSTARIGGSKYWLAIDAKYISLRKRVGGSPLGAALGRCLYACLRLSSCTGTVLRPPGISSCGSFPESRLRR